MARYSDIAGVRIIPPVVEFKDTEANSSIRINITVKNVSKTSKAIRYYGPQNSKVFRLKVQNPEKPVAPGLEVPAVVEYEPPENKIFSDRIMLTVDDAVIEVPLRGSPCLPNLILDGPVNFGNVVANSKVISREIQLANHGSKAGDFKIKYTGEKPITIMPASGTVPPGSAQIVKIEYVTKLPGKFDEVAKVKLEGHNPSTLQIKGNVVEGSLEILSPSSDEPVDCVQFGTTYYGTDKTESAILFNNGPEPVCFVAVLDEDALGQEVGVDLTKSTAATLAAQMTEPSNRSGQMNELTSLVTAIPNQGMLRPYEKIPLFFRFSPRWNSSSQGFKSSQEQAPRKDFALFMQLKIIGASQGFQQNSSTSKSNVEGVSLEVALTGTALPVLLSVQPQMAFDFGDCPVREHVDMLCTLKNMSDCLPATFQFRRVAHFTSHPNSGKIKAGESQDVIFSFAPNQVGTFKPLQYVDVVGQVADNQNPFIMHLQVIQSLPIQLVGKSDPTPGKRQPVFNSGITPKISNEVGMFVDTRMSAGRQGPAAALLNAQGTRLHRNKSSKDRQNESQALIAFPNDRAGSIRPSNRNEAFKTIFTRADRHTYVDPDYAYTEDEAEAIKAHKAYYLDFINYLRENRRNRERAREFKETNNDVDIAIKPAAGLRPKKLTVEEVKPDPKPPTPPNSNFKLLSTKQLAETEKASSQKMEDGLNAVPTTPQEKADCSRILSPQELHQVVVGPPTIDFGQVCLRSISQRELNIVNNLNQFIHIVVHVDCRELRQTSPLSQVVPPCSKAMLPLIFDSGNKGYFQRSLDFTINGFYKNHVTVFAEVVPVALQLSTEELILEPNLGLPADAGLRGVITLCNKLNLAAEFTWTPILGERGTAFSIRPATGVVDAFKDLDCEVVFHPSFMAPEEGFFALQVHGGNTLKLKCTAKLGPTNVQFIDRRVMFGQVPLHLTTTRVAMIRNNSLNHAFFQVLDPNPFPGLSVSPLHGVIPVGGTAELKVQLTPNAVIKFDTRVQVAIRGARTLELRMGGTVEPPVVDIDVEAFNFGGIYCGSSATSLFRLANRTNTKTRMEFDLSRYSDFSLAFPGKQMPEDFTFQLMNPGIFSVTLEASEIIHGELTFEPKEVASYDYVVPVTINQTGAPSPSPTPFPPTPAPSQKNSLQHIINPRPVHVSITTPRRKVIATALRQPLQLSHNKLEFLVAPDFHQLSTASGIGHTKSVLLVNNSDTNLKWAVNLAEGNQILEEGVFKFLRSSGMPFLSHGEGGVEGSLDPGQTQSLGVLFCPDKPGHFEVSLPLVINDEWDKPYQYLTLVGELKSPKLWFDPLAIVLTPVPLDTDISAEFHVMAANYTRVTSLQVETPEVQSEDGSKLSPLTVAFVGSREVHPHSSDDENAPPSVLRCRVTFKSSRPVSFSQPVVFIDADGNMFSLMVTATADNCLLTCYPFLAQHRTDHQIVCEQGTTLKGRKTVSRESVNVGEAVLVPCGSPPRPSSRPSTTATSSNFEISTSSYEGSSQSLSESTSLSTPREGALNKFPTDSDGQSRSRNDITTRSLGSALFPEEDSEEGIFHTEVLLAVQRWFSSQGWSGGPHPITIPHAMRNGISKKPNEEKSKNAKGGTWEANNLKKEFKTVYDMISHLSGKQVPGIPINNPLPTDPTERAKQVYWQHSTLLTFLKTQGACVSSIKPEYLMEPGDYKRWVALQKEIEVERHRSGHREIKMKTEEEEAIEDQLFEAVSKRAWTDILLQLLKTLVLARITPRQFKQLSSPYKALPTVDPDPLCSNVYSLGERILLLWLNHNYEQQRSVIWSTCTKGGVPPSRWVVNFDFDLLDGLVLASAIGAHAPFLVKTHLHNMYTQPATAEQCLHNALSVVSALRVLGIDYDIQAIDITDPNPISLLLLCAHLYNHLPHYLPKSTVDFIGGLHTMVLRQVRLSNPSSKPLTYQAMLAGHDAADFHLPKGLTVVIPPKSTHNLSIEFTSRFLRPAEATLVLVGRRQGSNVGSTLVFNLRTQVDNISPKTTIRFESPCYELNKIPVEVTNPFPRTGDFKLVLVEARGAFPGQNTQTGFVKASKKKVKKIRSRTNHGQNPAMTPQPEAEVEATQQEESEEADTNAMSAFHSAFTTVTLQPNGKETIEIDFLPFQTGKRQCSIIFISENVGEFLYSIEATATLPLPAHLPFRPSPHSVRISSAAAAGSGRGMFGGDESIVYWKCECGQRLEEMLTIPVTNPAREHALVVASQQHMTREELQRRLVTGTLTSATLTAKTVGILSARPGLVMNLPKKNAHDAVFKVELDSKYFTAPPTVVMPNPLGRRPSPPAGPRRSASQQLPPAQLQRASGVVMDQGSLDLPVTFLADESGHYPCRVVLRSQDDVRVYHIECTVIPEGSEAEISFTSPVHQPVTQNIPMVNPTNHDWPISIIINGDGFVGPSSMLAKAYQTTLYPLIFRPKYEGSITGQLVMMNTADHVEHKFALTGHGERPLPLEQLIFHCAAKQTLAKKVHVPNVTQKKLHYKVESDLDFISGKEIITVLPGKSVEYELTVTPLKRGAYKGIISFVATSNPVKDQLALQEVDSDGDEVPDEEGEESAESLDGYRVWYAVEVFVDPPPPERTLQITCACQKKAVLEVGLTNPTNHNLMLSVDIAPNNQGLSGTDQVTLPPQARGVYNLEYAPAIVGQSTASLVFYNPVVGEFWYHLELTAETPAPTHLPRLECELGRWVRQYIDLYNPTDELLMLVPVVSNTNNFVLERDNDQPLELRPHSSVRVPITFMPSALGEADHRATVTFHSEQLGEWVYLLSGVGRLPQPQDPVSITAVAGSNSTLIIPFRNPLDIAVIADIVLKDKEPITPGPQDVVPPASPFCLLLKHTTSLRLGPKSNIDIPISFAPEDMRRFDAYISVTIRQEDGSPWIYNLREESEHVPGPQADHSLSVIRWEYLVHGYPELTTPDAQPALVLCQARQRVEERLEVTLSGVAPSAGGPKRGIRTRARTPATADSSPKTPDGKTIDDKPTDGVVVSEALAPADEFTYELVYDSADTAKNLEPAVALSLVRTSRDKHTGLVMLLFNIIYAPYKTMLHDCELLVKGATGGIWKFPVRFVATEPEPDDVITIEAAGLDKEASLGFRLTSMARMPMQYNAYFVAGSDAEFSVSPSSGELLPAGTKGSLIKITFSPCKYGKVYQGKLVVQTADMQWTYNVRGVLPDYVPPRGLASRPMAGPHPDPRHRRDRLNYVRENLRLTTTAVSSPIKGVPVVRKQFDKLVL